MDFRYLFTGLVVWLLLVRSGPFGDFDLIYTRRAMVLAQFLIATPIVIGFTTASFQALPQRLPDLLAVLGAGRLRTLWILAREARLGVLVVPDRSRRSPGTDSGTRCRGNGCARPSG